MTSETTDPVAIGPSGNIQNFATQSVIDYRSEASNISREYVKHVESQVPPQACRIRLSGVGPKLRFTKFTR